jgi:predicted nucleic acid-binding protein
VIIADTSGLLAFFNRTEPLHIAVREMVADVPDPLVVSPCVIAEIDHLVATRISVDAEVRILRELSGGAYLLPGLGPDDLARTADVVHKYRDLGIGVADASLVVLAERYATRTILTLDHRHFGVLRPLQGGRFRLLP